MYMDSKTVANVLDRWSGAQKKKQKKIQQKESWGRGTYNENTEESMKYGDFCITW